MKEKQDHEWQVVIFTLELVNCGGESSVRPVVQQLSLRLQRLDNKWVSSKPEMFQEMHKSPNRKTQYLL